MQKLFILFSLIIVSSILSLSLMPAVTLAQTEVGELIQNQLQPIENVYSPDEAVDAKTFSRAIAEIIRVILGFLGIIFVVLIIYAGFTWMTAAGNEEKITKAKKIMVSAIIGTAIILAAYAITFFVISELLEATGAEGL